MTLRTIEEQFEPGLAEALREFQRRLEAVRTTNEASDYFIFETISCIDGGLLLAALQLATATMELRAREILIQHSISGSSERQGAPFAVETNFEEDRAYLFYGILGALETRQLISTTDHQKLKGVYQRIRIPLHHGIVGRYSRSRDDGSAAWVWEALFGDSQVHLTTSQSAMESAIDRYAVDDLEHVISALEILSPKLKKHSFPASL